MAVAASYSSRHSLEWLTPSVHPQFVPLHAGRRLTTRSTATAGALSTFDVSWFIGCLLCAPPLPPPAVGELGRYAARDILPRWLPRRVADSRADASASPVRIPVVREPSPWPPSRHIQTVQRMSFAPFSFVARLRHHTPLCYVHHRIFDSSSLTFLVRRPGRALFVVVALLLFHSAFPPSRSLCFFDRISSQLPASNRFPRMGHR